VTAAARRIEEAAESFWKRAGGRRKFGLPVDLDRAVALALPLGIVRMPALSTAKVAAVLQRIGTVPWSARRDRALRGCLVADMGVGLVFLDGSDPADEQRYSLAHEAAHFLLHYIEPRGRVLETLGPSANDVLDRKRLPTPAERLSSALAAVTLEPFRHAMERGPDGAVDRFRTGDIENEADDLAMEILVPLAELDLRHDLSVQGLSADYGIPPWAAGRLVSSKGSESDGVINIFGKRRF
jgi:hypothetical protein